MTSVAQNFGGRPSRTLLLLSSLLGLLATSCRTVLSLATRRPCCREKMRSKSCPCRDTKSSPGWAAGTLNWRFPNVVAAEKAIGFPQHADPGQAQLLRQSPLPGAEAPLAAPPRLRRVGRNHLDIARSAADGGYSRILPPHNRMPYPPPA